MDNKEIEIKLQIEEKDYYRLSTLMEKTAAFEGEKKQIDKYYSPIDISFYDRGDRCLRVRAENNTAFLSYKRIYEKGTQRQFIEEFETRVDNPDMIDNILKALGYRAEIIVDKHRLNYRTINGFLIALDSVKNLGFFIEVENVNESETVQKRNLDLERYVSGLDLSLAKRNTEGYSNMLYRKLGEA